MKLNFCGYMNTTKSTLLNIHDPFTPLGDGARGETDIFRENIN